jgi:glycosyltransferase involved in cell wall biosynthesis
MKMLFLTLGDETIASSRTRVFQYLPYLKNDDISCKVLIYTNRNLTGKKLLSFDIEKFYYALVMIDLLMRCFFYDIIFIQKVLLPEWYLRALRLIKGKRKMVFDFDDAVYTVHQSIDNSADSNVRNKIRDRFEHIVAASDLVILENDYTRRYAERHNTGILIITGPIDTERYFPSKRKNNDNSVVVGWVGTPSNTIYIEPIFPVFKRLTEKYPNVCFKFIGASPIDIAGVAIKQVDWTLETEVQELQEFDIGIMPLPDDEWSRGKGGYKLLQYMALGIPSVASPVGINAEMIEEDINGFLADTEDEWFEKLSLLIDNHEKRETMGLNAREIVEKRYSLFRAAIQLKDALRKLSNT